MWYRQECSSWQCVFWLAWHTVLAERQWASFGCMLSHNQPFSDCHIVCILCQLENTLCQLHREVLTVLYFPIIPIIFVIGKWWSWLRPYISSRYWPRSDYRVVGRPRVGRRPDRIRSGSVEPDFRFRHQKQKNLCKHTSSKFRAIFAPVVDSGPHRWAS